MIATLRRLSLPLGALALLWPYLVNGGPILFPDSVAYIRGAATGFELLLGLETRASDDQRLPEIAEALRDPARESAPESASGGDGASATTKGGRDYTVSSARSPWYGSLLFLSLVALGPVGPVVAQALALVLAVGLTARAVFGRLWPAGPLLAAAAAATPAALFVCYLTPDVFAGVAILATANLVAFGDRLDRGTHVLWWALLTAAMLFHLSHVPLVLGAAALALAGRLALRRSAAVRPSRRGLVTVAAALAATFVGMVSYGTLASAYYGRAPLTPPFLTARLVVDGPGYEYLVETCPESGYALCAFVDRLPGERIRAGRAAGYSGTFLWNRDPERGVYSAVDVETQAVLSAEQIPFALSVLAHDPVGMVSTMAGNVYSQLVRDEVAELDYEGGLRRTLTREADRLGMAGASETAAFRGDFPFEAFDAYYGAVGRLGLVVATLAALWLALRPPPQPALDPDERADAAPGAVVLLIAMIGLGLVLNAAVTGALSAVAGRYQARVLWLCLTGALIAVGYLAARRRARAGATPA